MIVFPNELIAQTLLVCCVFSYNSLSFYMLVSKYDQKTKKKVIFINGYKMYKFRPKFSFPTTILFSIVSLNEDLNTEQYKSAVYIVNDTMLIMIS